MAKVVHFYFNRDSGYVIDGFTVDKQFNNQATMCGLDVFDFESLEETHPPSDCKLFIAIGPSQMNAVRERKFHEAKEKGYRLASYISPHAICDSPVGENSFVGDHAIIHPFVTVGNNNFFWEQCFIGNDSTIGNNCLFSPKSAVSTFANIGDNSILGTGAIVKTSVHIARETLIGAGCYISKDTEIKGVYGEKSSPLYGCVSDKINISA